MKKKLIALFCLLSLLLTTVPAAALEGEALRSADLLATLNLVNGKENGDYALDTPATRAQAAVLLVRLAGAESAAKKIFPDGSAVPHKSFKEAYEAVVSGECDCAVLPLENSYEGDVSQVMDLTFFGPLYINGIYDMEICQNLLGVQDATLSDVKEVLSHPQALGQCARYLRERGLTAVEESNTAAAARRVAMEGRKELAAIASADTAELYGLKLLDKSIHDESGNTTRFAVFSRNAERDLKKDRYFVLTFTVKNEAGSLGKAVSAIGNAGFNLRALKSRPSKDLIWEYYFFAEGEGDILGPLGEEMMFDLKKHCSTVKLVGTFGQVQKLER